MPSQSKLLPVPMSSPVGLPTNGLERSVALDPSTDAIQNSSGDARRGQKRARKSQAFTCSWNDCRRVFGKLEHLQRHQRSHAGDVRYECPICKKRFVRSDVMARHTAIHEQESIVNKPRKVSCISCATLKVRCDSQPGSSCTRCQNSKLACTYKNLKRAPLSSREPSTSGTSSVSPAALDSVATSNFQAPVDNAASQIDYGLTPPALDINSSGQTNAAYQTVDDSFTAFSPLPVSYDFSNLPLESLYGFVMDSSDSYLGWGMDSTELDHMNALNTHAPNSPPANWFPTNPFDSAGFIIQEPEYSRDPVSAAPVPSHSSVRDSQPADSPWPHVYKPNTADSQLNLPSVSQRSRPTLSGTHFDRVGDSTREAMLSLISISHQSHWPVVDVAAFPSTQTLTVCINLYFQHFHETLPILRRSTFRIAETAPVLLLAMAAIGAMYSRDGLAGLAVAMNELTRRSISFMRESDRRVMFDTSIIKAWLLQSMFGLFCGSRMLYQHAEISRGGLVTAARRMHLLRPSLSFVEEIERRRVTATPEELRQACADDEERRRLGWGIYLYDMQISCLLNIAPLFSVGDVNMPLPSSEEIWNAPTISTSFESELVQSNSSNFRVVMSSLISDGKLSQPLNPFGFSLVAHTLYRLCTDACEHHWITSEPWAPTDSQYRLAFSSNFKQNPQELLDQLSASCYSLSCMPNSLVVSVSALSHHGHIQFTWPGFLHNIKVAAGKSGTERSKADARLWLSTRISEDQRNARSILVHAGQLSALLTRFTFDAPSESVWIFDAALTFWAIIKFGIGLGGLSASQGRTIVTWSGSNEVDGWIQNGGPVSFQGIGDLAELSVSRVLSVFSERLENMPWGIADRFRHVLDQLDYYFTMSVAEQFKLNTGASIPSIGLGTWQAKPGEVGKAVLHALKSGYKHLDCALIYQNEKEVGDAIKSSGVPRKDIFITSKVWNTHQNCVAEGLKQSLEALQTEYLDLYLIHWPVRLVPNETSALFPTNEDGSRSVDSSWNQQDTWRRMEEVYKSGKVKAIGVSNWSIPYLEHLEKSWTVVPAVNQVELHPYNPQHQLKKWCEDRGILLQAYCPLGSTSSPLLTDPQIVDMAAKYNVTPATILISYQINRGCIVLPKSVTPSRIEENHQAIHIAGEDMEILESMAANGKQQRVNTPLWGHDLGFDDWYGPGNKNAPKK
ncbi:hypothetical protein V502_11042 [Pseudogymnoascus sp. VKM F-4520 (FW-2644)]|nr:hypothetical protein V502_11042 [Pseudogymnoascus sp. VKM F-4520 (FW-2644)]